MSGLHSTRVRGLVTTMASRIGWVACLCVFWGCRAAEPWEKSRDGQWLENLPPAPYTVAISPIYQLVAGKRSLATRLHDAGSPLVIPYAPESFRKQIVARMIDQRAASYVFAVGNDDVLDAKRRSADLLLRPVLRSAAYMEPRERTWSDIGTNIVYWFSGIGQMFHAERPFDLRSTFDVEVVDVHEARTIDSFVVVTGARKLSFWERTPLKSWQFPLQFLWIPAFSFDHKGGNEAALSDYLRDVIAGRAAKYLKEDINSILEPYRARFQFESPENGSVTASDRIELRGKVIARRPILALYYYKNGRKELARKILDPPPIEEQRTGDVFVVSFYKRIALDDKGINRIALWADIQGAPTSRTLSVDYR